MDEFGVNISFDNNHDLAEYHNLAPLHTTMEISWLIGYWRPLLTSREKVSGKNRGLLPKCFKWGRQTIFGDMKFEPKD